MSEEASKLAGIIDGVAMTEEAAKLLWKEFSEHMEANRGDMAGYAKKRAWFSVLPEYRGGKAVLIVKTTANAKGPPPVGLPQKPKPKPQPKAKQGAKPQPKGGAKPQPKGGAKPQPKGGAKPQQGAKPQPKAAPKPSQKVAAKPQAGQKAPQKPGQPASPRPQNGGGQAPPKKRPS
jgi:hypothetical protein